METKMEHTPGKGGNFARRLIVELLEGSDEGGEAYENARAEICGRVKATFGLTTQEAARRLATYPALVEAVERIGRAKPDGLDHSADVAIIERAAKIAQAALAATKGGGA